MDVPSVSEVGLVLSGGGARGAYEVGVLTALLPYLERQKARPRVIVGTSAGALNAALVASTAHLPAAEAVDRIRQPWQTLEAGDFFSPPVSGAGLKRAGQYVGSLLGVKSASPDSLLGTDRLRETIARVIDFEAIERNVDHGVLASVAVAATSYESTESVIFHRAKYARPEFDAKRLIRYVPTRLMPEHVHASVAIEALFPAARVQKPASAAGWYGDGGLRLNTPIKPALRLGAERMIVVGLDPLGLPDGVHQGKPDVFDGISLTLRAMFAAPLAHDIATLRTINDILVDGNTQSRRKVIPYVLVEPENRHAIGEIAADIYRTKYSNPLARLRDQSNSQIGKLVDGGRNAARGDLLSLLFVCREFLDAMMVLGESDANKVISRATGRDGVWRV